MNNNKQNLIKMKKLSKKSGANKLYSTYEIETLSKFLNITYGEKYSSINKYDLDILTRILTKKFSLDKNRSIDFISESLRDQAMSALKLVDFLAHKFYITKKDWVYIHSSCKFIFEDDTIHKCI
ncbi:MAG: hypothetical protein ACRCYE_06415 [Sarcina sp.]